MCVRCAAALAKGSQFHISYFCCYTLIQQARAILTQGPHQLWGDIMNNSLKPPSRWPQAPASIGNWLNPRPLLGFPCCPEFLMVLAKGFNKPQKWEGFAVPAKGDIITKDTICLQMVGDVLRISSKGTGQCLAPYIIALSLLLCTGLLRQYVSAGGSGTNCFGALSVPLVWLWAFWRPWESLGMS